MNDRYGSVAEAHGGRRHEASQYRHGQGGRDWRAQCISIVDAGGNLLAFARMDGAFVLSIKSSLVKALTAASYGEPTGNIPAGIDLKLAIATQGKRVNLPGGLPIIVDGHVIGGIGVGSGTGEQDRIVAEAALGALAGTRRFG